MKKLINLFIIPILAGMVITIALHQCIGYAHITSITQLDHNQTDITFGLLGFLFGFLPSFIWGLAVNWQAANFGVLAEPEPVYIEPAKDIFVGKLVTSPGANCYLRVKALKVAQILEYNNPDYQDYL